MATKKLKFRSTETVKIYRSNPDFHDKEIHEVDEDEALRLLRDYPDNFEEVKATAEADFSQKSKKSKAEPPENKAMSFGGKDDKK